MAYRPISRFKNLHEQLRQVTGPGDRTVKREKAAIVAAYAVRAQRYRKIGTDLAAHCKNAGVARRSNSSPSLPLIRAAYAGLRESNYTRLAQLVDRAIKSGKPSAEVYARILEGGFDVNFGRRKIVRRT